VGVLAIRGYPVKAMLGELLEAGRAGAGDWLTLPAEAV
jgi:hypothetical protein